MTREIAIWLVALGLCLLLGAYSFYRHQRVHFSLRPRMIPWAVISMGFIATGFMIGVHLINLAGYHTGRL